MSDLHRGAPCVIISGGQTGADRGGLDFAIQQGLEHGGWCPAGRRSEDGPIPACYNLRETHSDSSYPTRTRLNVFDSGATVIFNRGESLSPGTKATLTACKKQGKPVLLLSLPAEYGFLRSDDIASTGEKVATFLAQYQPRVLNIAGNRETSSPGVSAFVRLALGSAWIQFEQERSQNPELF